MGTLFNREHEPPDDEPVDTAYALARGILDVVPGLAELFQFVFVPPVERRNREWMGEIAEVIRRLESARGISPEQLRDNPLFIDAVLAATAAAVRTSQTEKRRALRNAVMNAALPDAPDALRQQCFLGLIDRFTTAHLGLLGLFRHPADWRTPDNHRVPVGGNAKAHDLLRAAFPDSSSALPLYEQAWADLYTAGLVKTSKIDNGMEGPVMEIHRCTPLGEEFFRFIKDPLA